MHNKLSSGYIKNIARIMKTFNISGMTVFVFFNESVKTFQLMRLDDSNWNVLVLEKSGNELYEKLFPDFKELLSEFKTCDFYMADIL